MPFVEVWVDAPDPSFEDCDDDVLVKELTKRGFLVRKHADDADPAPAIPLFDKHGTPLRAIASIDLTTVRHKLSIHMKQEAADEALFLVERALDMPHIFSIN